MCASAIFGPIGTRGLQITRAIKQLLPVFILGVCTQCITLPRLVLLMGAFGSSWLPPCAAAAPCLLNAMAHSSFAPASSPGPLGVGHHDVKGALWSHFWPNETLIADYTHHKFYFIVDVERA